MTHPYRYALTVEYDGGLFSGWQRQDTAPSVQHVLEQAIQSLTQQCVFMVRDRCRCAWGQVACIDVPKPWPAYKVRQGGECMHRRIGTHACTLAHGDMK